MNIKDLIKKYELLNSDCWALEIKNKEGRVVKTIWIITHDATEKIMVKENIEIIDMTFLNSEKDFVRCVITATKGDRKVMTIGEAMKGNCMSNYYGCMAEKRGIDRAVLKLIDAYQYGLKSEEEADDFKQPTDPKPSKTVEQTVSDVFDGKPDSQLDKCAIVEKRGDIPEEEKAKMRAAGDPQKYADMLSKKYKQS